jgi:hypothetical protein
VRSADSIPDPPARSQPLYRLSYPSPRRLFSLSLNLITRWNWWRPLEIIIGGNLLAYSIEQRTSWEANRSSASQEIPRMLWNPKFHYRIHNSTTHVPIPSQTELIHASTHLSNIGFYYPPIYAWTFQVESFLQVCPPKPCMHLSFPPYVLRPLPISVFLINCCNLTLKDF